MTCVVARQTRSYSNLKGVIQSRREAGRSFALRPTRGSPSPKRGTFAQSVSWRLGTGYGRPLAPEPTTLTPESEPETMAALENLKSVVDIIEVVVCYREVRVKFLSPKRPLFFIPITFSELPANPSSVPVQSFSFLGDQAVGEISCA